MCTRCGISINKFHEQVRFIECTTQKKVTERENGYLKSRRIRMVYLRFVTI